MGQQDGNGDDMQPDQRSRQTSASPSALATHRVVWAEAIPHDVAAPLGLEVSTLCRQARPAGASVA